MIELPELYTSRWANKELDRLHCQPVGISRGNPRWRLPFRYKLARELAPSREAFSIQDWAEFETAYGAGLEKIGLEAIVGKLARISEEAGGLPLVLLCFEADPGGCHRGLLAAWLQQRAGVIVPELKAGDLLRRTTTPAQQSLF